uniref:Uncharacterized protein n=1 Tax=uncultured marine group II/III euryarchaeote KM3_77_B08 TaxID=1456508 RepID=A0A075HN73_9EURY|nr:hypothetical protein [uncultured marine group II/III euryarchaeote KM3_77_B08]
MQVATTRLMRRRFRTCRTSSTAQWQQIGLMIEGTLDTSGLYHYPMTNGWKSVLSGLYSAIIHLERTIGVNLLTSCPMRGILSPIVRCVMGNQILPFSEEIIHFAQTSVPKLAFYIPMMMTVTWSSGVSYTESTMFQLLTTTTLVSRFQIPLH